MKRERHPLAVAAESIYAARNRILCRLGTVPVEDLTRLADILEALPDEDIRAVAVFAESLALWPAPAVGSNNGPEADEQDFGG